MRVLHIAQPLSTPAPWFAFSRIDGHCAGEGGLLAAADLVAESAASNPDEQHHVAVLGSAGARALCRHLPLRGVSFVSPPLGQAHRCAPAMRRLVSRSGPLDAVVCWGTNLRRLARRTAYAAPRWLEVDMQSGDARFLRPGRGEVSTPCASVLPHGWGERGSADTRATARARLGLADGEAAIVLLTDAACPGSATDFLGTAAMLQVAGVAATYIIPAACAELARAERRVREGTYARRVIVTDLPASFVAQGADIAVCCPASAGALGHHASLSSIARAAARAGTTVVLPDAWADVWFASAPDSKGSVEASGDAPLMVRSNAATPTEVARAMLPIMLDFDSKARRWLPTAQRHSAPSLLDVLRAEVGSSSHRG